jgi:hypothetical protein
VLASTSEQETKKQCSSFAVEEKMEVTIFFIDNMHPNIFITPFDV